VLCSAAEAGDEPFLLAQQCSGVRVVVNADRYEAGKWLLERANVDVFLLDDGFQHVQLHRDLNVALVDAREDLSKARMLPLGHWREPLDGLRRADVVIVTRADDANEFERLRQQLKKIVSEGTPIYAATHKLTDVRQLPANERFALADFAAKPISVMTAIAQPERLYSDLLRRGLSLATKHAFADHHRYSLTEVHAVLTAAQQAGASALFVTEKDAANLPTELWAATLPLPLYAVQLNFACESSQALREIVMATL
jgi:tetraacyldisaccharide 4'-kinase